MNNKPNTSDIDQLLDRQARHRATLKEWVERAGAECERETCPACGHQGMDVETSAERVGLRCPQCGRPVTLYGQKPEFELAAEQIGKPPEPIDAENIARQLLTGMRGAVATRLERIVCAIATGVAQSGPLEPKDCRLIVVMGVTISELIDAYEAAGDQAAGAQLLAPSDAAPDSDVPHRRRRP